MNLPIFFIINSLAFFHKFSNCQQQYIANKQLDCSLNPSISKGYHCNGPQKSCRSFVTFRSKSPYETTLSIAYLLGSEATTIASINNVSNIEKITPNKLIIVPVSCSCSGNIYQHLTPYTVKGSDHNYFQIANETYQGLTTCQALKGRNYYDNENLKAGTELMVPLRCACPSQNQTQKGVTSLLTYMVVSGDALSLIAEYFGASLQSVLKANKLSENSIIYPFTPILVPRRSENCTVNPESSACKCPRGYHGEWNLEGLTCIHDSKIFPVKLVTILSISLFPSSLLILVFFLCLIMQCSSNCFYGIHYFHYFITLRLRVV